MGSCAGLQLEHQLVLVAEVDGLQVLPLVQVPEVQPPAVLGAEQHLRDQAVLERVGRAPFAGDEGVVAQVPPGIVGEVLGPAVHLPLAAHVEGLVVHQEHAARSLALPVAERGHVDALGSTVDRMRPGVAGLVGHLARLDHLHDLGFLGIGLGVEDVDARGPQARHHQVAPFDVSVRRVGTQTRRAGVPAEVMQLVARVRHDSGADDGRIGLGFGIDIDHGDRIGRLAIRIEGRHVGQRFRRRLHRHARGGVETGIRCPGRHGAYSSG